MVGINIQIYIFISLVVVSGLILNLRHTGYSDWFSHGFSRSLGNKESGHASGGE